ncbi:MAG: hypothetical protein PHW60_13515 [Kiritimatiellae bacterium]|nr:hypothetical protein [Kiritimatiellia bacterium]
MKFRDIFLSALVSVVIVLLIDAATNTLDIAKYSWDFRHYIALAEQGFKSQPLLSPFAYRYPTPLIAAGLTAFLGIPTAMSFKVIAYFGALLQLMGVFFFVQHFAKSRKSAFVALLVTAFSLCNVKFLLFDVYRPDHMAYAFVILGFYFGLTSRFYRLLITSAIGVQFREFAVLPLIAFMAALAAGGQWQTWRRYVLPVILCLLVAVALPRLLIPVTGSIQDASSLRAVFRIPFDFKRDLNLAYSVIAYFLPTLMLLDTQRFRLIRAQLPGEIKRFVLIYALLVILLSLYGGSDLPRFATYLFVVQALLIGLLCRMASGAEIGTMLIAAFIFNRMWMPLPGGTDQAGIGAVWNMDNYLDFWVGYASRVNWSTFARCAELIIFIAISVLMRRMNGPPALIQNKNGPRAPTSGAIFKSIGLS